MYSFEYKPVTTWLVPSGVNLEGLTITKSKKQGQIFSRITVDGSIMFYGSIFNALKSLSGLTVEARIKRDGVVVVSGYLDLLGKWDIDNSTCELDFVVEDAYTDILKVYDEEIEITGITKRTATLEIDSETKTVLIPRDGNPAPTPENNYTEGIHTDDNWVFVKEMILFPAVGWDYDPDLTGSNVPWVKHEGYSKETDTTQTIAMEFSYFYKLEDLLNLLVTGSDGNFDDSDWSDYIAADSELANLLIAHKKNIISPGEFVKEKKMSLSDLLDFMKAAFNLDWYLDESDSDNLKFKHPSEISLSLPSFVTLPAHDLTDFEGENWTTQKKVYTFSVDIPFKESWTTETTRKPDFNGLPIRYNIESEQSQEYELSKFQNDFLAILNAAGDGDNGDVDDNGFCLVAVDSSSNITTKAGLIETSETLVNGKLALSRLHDDHFKNGGRYFTSGTMNGAAETFTNTRRLREMDEIKVPATIDDFDFDYLVKTNQGNGEIVSISEPLDGSYATIKLIY